MSPREAQALDLFVSLNRSRRAIGRQIEDQLREAIRGGALVAGSKLPSTRALAEELAVSRGVVVRAYAQLAAEGYLDLRQGANPAVRAGTPSAPTPLPAGPDGASVKVRYDLRPHVPDVGMFPRAAWLRSLRYALATAADADLGYIDRRGLPQLRAELASYLGRARGVVAHPDDILITAGSTNSLSLIARALARSVARAIGFENPSHWLMHAVAERAGLEPVGIQVDQNGLRVDELSRAELGAVVVAPAHQFPTGRPLSLDRRTALVRWARTSGALIVEDEYDAEFRYDRAPFRALHGLGSEHVAYIGSTSKTVAPALRLGWAVLPPALAEAVAEELGNSQLHISGIEQLAFADFLRRGELDRHLRRMRNVYRRRRDALVAAVEQRLPQLAVRGIAAGLHVLLELPRGTSEALICREARSRGLLIESLSQHALPGYRGPAGLLIGYGGISEPAVAEAVEELAAAVAELPRPRTATSPEHARTGPVSARRTGSRFRRVPSSHATEGWNSPIPRPCAGRDAATSVRSE